MTTEQLEMFPLTESERFAIEIKSLREGMDKLRRSFFARNNDLESNVVALTKEVQDLKDKIKD